MKTLKLRWTGAAIHSLLFTAAAIERNYRAVANKNGRAIAGLSTGAGHDRRH